MVTISGSSHSQLLGSSGHANHQSQTQSKGKEMVVSHFHYGVAPTPPAARNVCLYRCLPHMWAKDVRDSATKKSQKNAKKILTDY